MKPGPLNLITDVPGLRVGNAQDDRIKTGCTVVLGDVPFVASCHVMGGAPGTRETDLLAPDKSVTAVDALVLSGGSAFGLDACSGVVDRLRANGRGFRVGDATIPLVPGAILFDLLNGGDKKWDENPYRALGAKAHDAATLDFPLGSVGAGTGALSAMVKGGLGSASLRLPDGTMVGALVGVNPVGAVTTPGDRHFYAGSYEFGDEFGGIGPDPNSGLGMSMESRKISSLSPRENTTIAIVATDATLTKAQCNRMATAAHDGIARACVPAHTPNDGDAVFALTTAQRDIENPARDLPLIGHAAALCLTRAIARAAYFATPAQGDLLPCWSCLNA